MMSDTRRMLATAAQAYSAGIATASEIGAMGLRAGADDAARIARAAAQTLRASRTERARALGLAVLTAKDAQQDQLHRFRGLSTLAGMSFLRHFDHTRAPEADL